MKRAHVYYSGMVQGVCFRFNAEDLAREYKLSGWVRNLPDGRVELLVEGEETTLKNFLTALKELMSPHIHDEKTSWEPATSEFNDFKIKF